MGDSGEMARLPELLKFADEHGLRICAIADLIKYRRTREILIERVEVVKMPTEFGEFDLYLYRSKTDGRNHLALVKGDLSSSEDTLVRVHSECLTGDVFGSKRCDCGAQLHQAMRMVAEAGKGVIVYMKQEGRGIGLESKIRAYKLQESGLDTVQANLKLGYPIDLREYGLGAQILTDLGLEKICLLTNNPKKIIGLDGYGLEVVKQIPIKVTPNEHNSSYLETKRDKMGHLL
jgi:3,4-dihydroxy 2-butanone 4-phosphate synthase/GTP cyclohydrolase II